MTNKTGHVDQEKQSEVLATGQASSESRVRDLTADGPAGSNILNAVKPQESLPGWDDFDHLR